MKTKTNKENNYWSIRILFQKEETDPNKARVQVRIRIDKQIKKTFEDLFTSEKFVQIKNTLQTSIKESNTLRKTLHQRMITVTKTFHATGVKTIQTINYYNPFKNKQQKN